MASIPPDQQLAWLADDWTQFRRFLCYGSETGPFSSDDKEPTRECTAAMKRLIERGDGYNVVQEIIRFSAEGRAAKKKCVIFALAVCAKDTDIKDAKVKQEANKATSQVLQIPTHLFKFLNYSHKIVRECSDNSTRPIGWGRSSKSAVSRWYNMREPISLAMQVTKYKQRHRWSHKDVLRLAHIKPKDRAHALVLCYAAKGYKTLEEVIAKDPTVTDEEQLVIDYLTAVNHLKHTHDEDEAVVLISKHKLVKEHVPTWFHNSTKVWAALLPDMPILALTRSLSKLGSIGLLDPMTADSCEKIVTNKLLDDQLIINSKIHPFNILVAHENYRTGKGDKGKSKWNVNGTIVDALLHAFYTAFKNVSATNKHVLMAIDISASMGYGLVEGLPGVKPETAAIAMTMLLQRAESSGGHAPIVTAFSSDRKLVEISISDRDTLDDVKRKLLEVPNGTVDPALAIQWAEEQKKELDAFIVFTDCNNEPGITPASIALKQYRKTMGINHAKLIFVSMTGKKFTMADPNDAGMLDIAGFDLSCPSLIQNFLSDNFSQ